jgi:multidrug efflux pump subunit AcrA (membrane-fusion protein)
MFMAQGRRFNMPSGATILAWLGVIGTILGILGFFISDLPGIFSDEPQGLSEDYIIATLAALQDDKERAELQLTQIALAEQRAANQATEQAISQQQANIEATFAAIQVQQDEVVATQNAVAALTATAEAANITATANADATGTVAAQIAQNETATAVALAQITPTATITPTNTPPPTATDTPAPVVDHRSLVGAAVGVSENGRLLFSIQAAQPIPDAPQDELAYIWSLDTDHDPETGLTLQDIGVDVRVAARFDEGAWVGTVRTVNIDGTFGEPFYFLTIEIDGAILAATLSPAEVGLPGSFDWVARAELGAQAYSFFPTTSHSTFGS